MRNVLVLLFFVTHSAISISVSGQTPIGGIMGNTTLKKINSPYILTSDILIPAGKTVKIEPGVTIYFQNSQYIQISGELIAKGTATDSIHFTRAPSATQWNGLTFMYATDYDTITHKGCILEYCRFSYANYCIKLKHETSIKINSCDFGYCGWGIYYSSSYPIITNNKFHDGFTMAIYGETKLTSQGFGALIENNEFTNIEQSLHLVGGVIRNNYINNNHYGAHIQNSIFTGNRVFNTVAGEGVWMSHLPSAVICNTFENNPINISVCSDSVVILKNNFLNYSTYNIQVHPAPCYDPPRPAKKTYRISNNYWNGLTESQIAASIFDVNDDIDCILDLDFSKTQDDSINHESLNCEFSLLHEYTEGTNNLYPNPNDGKVIYLRANEEIQEIILVNVLGQTEIIQRPGLRISTSLKGLLSAYIITDTRRIRQKILVLD